MTYVKPMCQTKIHGGQEKIEGVRIRVGVHVDACTRAKASVPTHLYARTQKAFALVDGCRWVRTH